MSADKYPSKFSRQMETIVYMSLKYSDDSAINFNVGSMFHEALFIAEKRLEYSIAEETPVV